MVAALNTIWVDYEIQFYLHKNTPRQDPWTGQLPGALIWNGAKLTAVRLTAVCCNIDML